MTVQMVRMKWIATALRITSFVLMENAFWIDGDAMDGQIALTVQMKQLKHVRMFRVMWMLISKYRWRALG